MCVYIYILYKPLLIQFGESRVLARDKDTSGRAACSKYIVYASSGKFLIYKHFNTARNLYTQKVIYDCGSRGAVDARSFTSRETMAKFSVYTYIRRIIIIMYYCRIYRIYRLYLCHTRRAAVGQMDREAKRVIGS